MTFYNGLLRGSLTGLLCACAMGAISASAQENVLPASDPENSQNWVLREDLSDEFDGETINREKWLVQGHNGDYYIWKGRAPSQFAPHNVFLEDGHLKIRSQWEPDYDFFVDEGHEGSGYGFFEGKAVPVTTGAVVGKKRFLYGYMEARTKAIDAAMTSAFWLIGHQQELDIYEQMGRPKLLEAITETHFKGTVHDWRPPAERPTRRFQYSQEVPYRVADEFHVYGAEWGPDYLKVYLDGEEIYHVTQADVGTDWVLNNPMEIWFDSEIFYWLGLPDAQELPGTYEIDYLRIWQRPSDNLLREHQAFFGFEGPILFQDQPRPMNLKPEDTETNAYQGFWQIDEASAANFAITDKRWKTGASSLKFTRKGQIDEVSVRSPNGSLQLPAGNYVFKVDAWLNDGLQPELLHLALPGANMTVAPIELAGAPRNTWTTLEVPLTLDRPTPPETALMLSIRGADIPPGAGDFYLDDIRIEAADPV